MPPTPPPAEGSVPNSLIARDDDTFNIQLEISTTAGIVYQIAKSWLISLDHQRVDPYTYTIGLRIGKALSWSDNGRKRMIQAVEDGRRMMQTAWSVFLKFGFNIKGSRAIYMETEYGQCFAALCASLCECYPEVMVAKLLLQLTKIILEDNKDDPNLEGLHIPSLQTFTTLVERFSGIFSSSEFGVIVEDYMSLDGQGRITGYTRPRSRSSRPATSRGIAHPEHIAAALYEIIQISRDKTGSRQVQFNGGADAIAVAAVGIWLVDLPTTFYQEDGQGQVEAVKTTCKSSEIPRVVVIFSENTTNNTALTKGRVIHLPKMTEIVKEKHLNPSYLIGGRCKWTDVLSKTFGKSFRDLMSAYISFGIALGAAARVFQALAEGDDEIPVDWRAECRIYFPSSFGLDYVNFALERFPELKSHKNKNLFEEQIREYANLRSFKEARDKFEEAMKAIARVCNCKYCCPCGFPSAARGSPVVNTNDPKNRYCLVALAGAIIRLIRCLSGIDFGPELQPKRAGIECFYNQQHDRQMLHRKRTRDPYNTDELFLYRILEYVRFDKIAQEYSLLSIANTIFSGKQIDKDARPLTSALSSEGICCFYKVLQEPSRNTAECSRVVVIPGSIEYSSQPYNYLIDFGYDPFKDVSDTSRNGVRPNIVVPEKVMTLMDACMRGNKINLVVNEVLLEERNCWLELGFEISGENGMLAVLGPAKIVEEHYKGDWVDIMPTSMCCYR